MAEGAPPDAGDAEPGAAVRVRAGHLRVGGHPVPGGVMVNVFGIQQRTQDIHVQQ